VSLRLGQIERRRTAQAVIDEAWRALDAVRTVSDTLPGRSEAVVNLEGLATALYRAEYAFAERAYFAARTRAMWVIARATEMLARLGATPSIVEHTEGCEKEVQAC